jgi:hypothetical protein
MTIEKLTTTYPYLIAEIKANAVQEHLNTADALSWERMQNDAEREQQEVDEIDQWKPVFF